MEKKKVFRSRKYEGGPAKQSLAEAFARTKAGQELVAEVRKEETDIALRVRTLKELAFLTFVSNVPGWIRHSIRQDGRDVRDTYRNPKVRERIRELGRKGGEEYECAIRTLKFTWDSPESYHESLRILQPLT